MTSTRFAWLRSLQWPVIGLVSLFLLAGQPWLAIIVLATVVLHRFLPTAPRRRNIGLVVETLAVLACVLGFFSLVDQLNTQDGLAYLIQLLTLETVCVVVAYEYLQRTRRTQRDAHDLALRERQLALKVDEARLQLLQAQVEPHFLFNTLAHLRRLAQTDVPAARAMLSELLQVLAEALPSLREPQTTLARELALVRAYLALHQRRMGEDRLRLRFDIAPELDALRLPSTALLTLVENAVKHGIAPQVQGGEIAVRAWREGARLHLEVQDTGRGMGSGSGKGTGLANLRARLKALHGEAAQLSLQLNEPQGLIVRIGLPAVT